MGQISSATAIANALPAATAPPRSQASDACAIGMPIETTNVATEMTPTLVAVTPHVRARPAPRHQIAIASTAAGRLLPAKAPLAAASIPKHAAADMAATRLR